jgi:hypothetical protein
MDILSRRKLKPESVPWLNALITEWESFLANLAEHQDAEISRPEGLERDADCQPYYYDEDLKRRYYFLSEPLWLLSVPFTCLACGLTTSFLSFAVSLAAWRYSPQSAASRCLSPSREVLACSVQLYSF